MKTLLATRLVLFDIDGTLLSSGRTAHSAFSAALVEVFGTAGRVDGYAFEGRLDPGIVTDLMREQGFEDAVIAARRERALSRYLDRLEENFTREKPTLKPGIVPLLQEITADTSVLPAILTGNVERGARLKLEAAGLWHHFAFGVWGDDAPRREELGPVALARARDLLGLSFTGPDCVVVGDSCHDVACGLAIGARVVAVATGRTPAAELAKAGATVVVPDFSDLRLAKEAILGA